MKKLLLGNKIRFLLIVALMIVPVFVFVGCNSTTNYDEIMQSRNQSTMEFKVLMYEITPEELAYTYFELRDDMCLYGYEKFMADNTLESIGNRYKMKRIQLTEKDYLQLKDIYQEDIKRLENMTFYVAPSYPDHAHLNFPKTTSFITKKFGIFNDFKELPSYDTIYN